MADDIARLGFEIDSSDARRASSDLGKLSRTSRETETRANRLRSSFKKQSGALRDTIGRTRDARGNFNSLSSSQDRARRSSDGLSSSVRRLGGAVAAYLSVRQIVEYAEAWTTLENRLKTVTGSQEELNFALDATFNIAQRSRAPLQSTAELYQRIQTNADALSLSGSEVAGVVETISKSLAISGTSAAAADAAMVQLGHAIVTGKR